MYGKAAFSIAPWYHKEVVNARASSLQKLICL